MIDSHHKHWSIGRRSRDDHFLGSSLGMSKSSCTGPVNVGRVTLIEDGDLVPIYIEEFAIFLHLTLELSMGGVILEHVDHVVKGDEGVIDCNNRCTLLNSSPRDQSANAAESIDSDLSCHLQFVLWFRVDSPCTLR